MSRSREAPHGESIDDMVRSTIASRVAVPAHLTEHGATAYAREAVARVDALARELDLMAVEARACGQRPEHTEGAITEACRRRVLVESGDALRRKAADLDGDRAVARQRGRLRRRWAVVLTTFGTAGVGLHDVAGPWGSLTIAASGLLLLGSAILTLAGRG